MGKGREYEPSSLARAAARSVERSPIVTKALGRRGVS